MVDAYTSDERAIGWRCYLDGKLRFPFKAKCIAVREISPLKKGEEVEVLGMAPEDDCMREMIVLVRYAGRKLGVPLAQIESIGADAATREAVADWRYCHRMERATPWMVQCNPPTGGHRASVQFGLLSRGVRTRD